MIGADTRAGSSVIFGTHLIDEAGLGALGAWALRRHS